MLKNLKKTIRQCCINHKKYTRDNLFRLVKDKNGDVFFDKNYSIPGRGVHFLKDFKTCEQIFSSRKKRRLDYLLKISSLSSSSTTSSPISSSSFSLKKFEDLKKEVFEELNHS